MATIIKSRQYDAMRGAWLEYGTFTLTPAGTAVISNGTELEVAADTNVSANTGDQIFVNGQNVKAGLIPKGARVTVNGTVKVLLANYSGSNVTDSTAETFDYMLLHYS